MDAITLLTHDHRDVEKLFKRFAKTGDRAHKTRRDLVDRMIRELAIHAAIEEQIFYPRLRDEGRRIEDEVLEGLEEHHLIKEVLADLDGMSPEAERFEARVTVLMEQVRHHVEEEEGEMFPHARRALRPAELRDLGEAMQAAKVIAPTRAHPNAPDEPPANMANSAVAAVDRARDITGKVVREAKKAATSRR